jgi:hypothetical protein
MNGDQGAVVPNLRAVGAPDQGLDIRQTGESEIDCEFGRDLSLSRRSGPGSQNQIVSLTRVVPCHIDVAWRGDRITMTGGIVDESDCRRRALR